MLKLLVALLSISVYVYAEISLEYITSKPKSRSKDFMIWQYLNQNITASQADIAYSQVKNTNNNKIFYRYAKKTNDKNVKSKLKCKKEKNLLSITEEECLKLAYSPKKSIHYTKKQRKKLVNSLKDEDLICLIDIQNEPNTQKAYENYSANTFLDFFNKVGYKYRNKNLNILLNEKFLNNLCTSSKVSQFIKTTVNTNGLYNLQRSLLNANGEFLDSTSNFFLAINHLNYNNETKAMEFFSLSKEKATTRINRDKNDFWQYQVSKDKDYLKKLLKSKDINIYTLYARELLKTDTTNYFHKVKINENNSETSLNNPFHWDEIYEEIKQTPEEELFILANKYNQKNMLPAQAYILQKANKYNIHAYVMPYDRYLKGASSHDKAIIYALMRQESHLIPSALSHSFAQGLMQMMPFVTNAISKEIRNPINNLNEMFEPENNLRYAKHHLKWMKRSLYHPLFIAYAYNGGMGFFKRYLLNNKFKKGKYEPFLSMEMMSNTESREYGKKVLANYVIYKKILGEKVSIVDLFDSLMQPKKTDRFRSSK